MGLCLYVDLCFHAATALSFRLSLVYVLRVDLVFTVDSTKSVSCDAMTNVGSCLDDNDDS